MAKQDGFTLIELMITIAIVGVLLLSVTGLTRSWVDRSQVNSAKSSLENAILQAKTLGLRNKDNKLFTVPSVTVCIKQDVNAIQVIQVDTNLTGLCDTAGNILLKTYSIAQGISITQNNNSVQCLSFNALGMQIYAAGSTCINDFSTNFNIGKNNENVTLSI